jgi:glycosyltransferase involved in cell wall biosynthesis
MGTIGRARGAITRLLRSPAEQQRRFDELQAELGLLRQELDRLRGAQADLGTILESQGVRLHDIATVGHRTRADLEGIAATTVHVAQIQALDAPSHAEEADGPLVSVILPCRDRSEALVVALRSVREQTYQRWECVVVDDGSTEDLAAALAAAGPDERIRLVANDRRGVSAARNRGISLAQGELITFLDSDNWWLPGRLTAVVDAYQAGAPWSVDRQLVLDPNGLGGHVRTNEQPLASLDEENFIDLGSVAVAAALLRRVGGESGAFDERLPRLADWDLVRRLAAVVPPARIPHLGQVYDQRGQDRISTLEAFGPSYHRVRRAALGRPGEGLRVLLAEWHFPQLTETYMQADHVGLRALGVEVEAWSDDDVATAYEPGIPVHRGSLADAIHGFEPDLVLTHWMNIGHTHRATIAAAGVPHAIRCHGFDFGEWVIDDLCRQRDVVVHLFPHLAGRWAGHPAVSVDPVGFDVARFRPSPAKDRRLVVRTTAALPTKDLEVFARTAARCPDHRFVLVLGTSYRSEQELDELREQVPHLGPVEVRVDVPHDEMTELLGAAGIYLHTHGDSHPMGMPVSIAEAMATGAYVLGRDLHGMAAYGRGAIDLYRGASADDRADHAAALINAALAWDDERWAAAARASLDVAWVHHAGDLVAARMLEVWRERLGVGRHHVGP